MTTTPHPDATTDWQAFKAIKRGSMQAADTAAMEAMFDALDAGVGKEEANEIFNNTYKNCKSHERRRKNQEAQA